ncbi:hypothetical protein SCP_0109490 [Sparassis crispa]|uniref:Uncharacterized protein n=1 Tax=Sparassis crispa TaxID=139825 RepID=A0A401G7D6_9APHY|nr:hypothetical protein SCP_0109490 [Sparassis crispa]GBE78067.1 hypothetical protein SCP_0109490 [Sparassis crispa]
MGACTKALTEGTLAMGPFLAVTCSGDGQPSDLWQWAHPSSYTLGGGPTAQKYPYGGGPTAQNITYGSGPTAQKYLYGGGPTA